MPIPVAKSNASENFAALKLFARVAQTGSFSKAANEFGQSQPTASRVVATLEKELGVALFIRTSRAVTLTEAGADYLARVEAILEALEEANHATSGTAPLLGRLRVGLSSSFAIREIIPRLPRFLAKHPGLRLELRMSDQRDDLVLEGVDVALRLGPLSDSGAIARKLMTVRRVLMAAPSYIEAAGAPMAPADLALHSVIAGPSSSLWTFRKGMQVVTVTVQSRLSVTVNEGALAAAVAGLGIVATGMIEPFPEIERGALTRVLSDWEMEPIEVHAVYAAGRAAKPAARVFTEFLVEDLKAAKRLP